MKKTLKLALSMMIVCSTALITSGCFTPHVWQENTRRVALKKAIMSGNEADIAAVRRGDVKSTNIEITKMEVIKERLGALSGAAALDTGIALGGVLLVDEVFGSDGSSSDKPYSEIGDTGGDATVININGDGNTITQSAAAPSEGVVLGE